MEQTLLECVEDAGADIAIDDTEGGDRPHEIGTGTFFVHERRRLPGSGRNARESSSVARRTGNLWAFGCGRRLDRSGDRMYSLS